MVLANLTLRKMSQTENYVESHGHPLIHFSCFVSGGVALKLVFPNLKKMVPHWLYLYSLVKTLYFSLIVLLVSTIVGSVSAQFRQDVILVLHHVWIHILCLIPGYIYIYVPCKKN